MGNKTHYQLACKIQDYIVNTTGVGKKTSLWDIEKLIKESFPLEPPVSPQPTSTGEYDYRGYHIKTANKNGGKAGKNHNRTSTLQITESVGTGYYIKKQYSFIVGNKESYDKAWTKMIKWIDNNPLVAG